MLVWFVPAVCGSMKAAVTCTDNVYSDLDLLLALDSSRPSHEAGTETRRRVTRHQTADIDQPFIVQIKSSSLTLAVYAVTSLD